MIRLASIDSRLNLFWHKRYATAYLLCHAIYEKLFPLKPIKTQKHIEETTVSTICLVKVPDTFFFLVKVPDTFFFLFLFHFSTERQWLEAGWLAAF